jgi:dTMP kinase
MGSRTMPEAWPGKLITFEGPEGSGKSTLVGNLAQHLLERGCESLVLREPGGTEIGEQVRSLLLDPQTTDMCAETELLLMLASRAQLVRQKIRPALEAGMVVLCDRFADASVAYQGYGRGLPVSQVERGNELALGGIRPDLTFLCLLPPDDGRARLRDRQTDRLDRETHQFHQRVYEGYCAMAASGDPRFQVIDASQTPAQMLAQAVGHLRRLEHGLLKFL